MTVPTFLFSDIEGSTRLWEAFPSAMNGAISRYDELLHGTVEQNGGEVFKHTGDGMAAVFPDSCSAINASVLVLPSNGWIRRIGQRLAP